MIGEAFGWRHTVESELYEISSKRDPIKSFRGHIRVQDTQILQIMSFKVSDIFTVDQRSLCSVDHEIKLVRRAKG